MSLEFGNQCWRVAQATRASVIVDADDYFTAARSAMIQAEHRIMLIGWDFDARIAFGRAPDDGGPATVGEFILWLAKNKPGLDIYLLRWSIGALKTLGRGTTLWTTLKWMRHPRIHTKLDSVHPLGASHHQKIVVIDDGFAFCGGIDMTSERWDTRAHRDDDPGRRRPNGSRYDPWHDATSALQGPAATALGDLCRDRWARAGCHPLAPVERTSAIWPDALPVDFENVDVGIARSFPASDGEAPIVEIEALYLALIKHAKRWIYAESQYFASRRVAEAIAKRLDEADGPEVVIINPVTAQGWLEPLAMDTARARLYTALKARDLHDRLRMYHPHTEGGTPIYVHAKILIVDDDVVRVGSSNFNNRSLRLDTECDIVIQTTAGENDEESTRIAAIRNGLIAEHLDVPVRAVTDMLTETGSLVDTVDRLRGSRARLRPYQVPDLSEVEKWLADNEVLDPEGPDEMFEALTKRGLFRRTLNARKATS